MMQVYGFARIYDAKARPDSRTPALLDEILCLLWFGMCVFVLNDGMTTYLISFYQSGGPRMPADGLQQFVTAWLAVTLAVTLVYVVHTLGGIWAGRRPNPVKFLFIAATFLYLSYTISVVERPVMGLVLFESWHDVQYLAIVWMACLNRTRKNTEAVGPFSRFLFRPRVVLVAAYVGICLAFGSLTHAWRLFEDPVVVRLLVALTTATAMVHYCLDGFIWKIREPETGEAVGVGRAVSERVGVRLPVVPSWARHAALWLLFIVPVGMFYAVESRGDAMRPLQIYENLAAVFPNAGNMHYELGRELANGGSFREARSEFERAVELAPNLLPARILLGVLMSDQHDLEGARAEFERALVLDPRNATLHNNLGTILDESGDLEAARVHLETAVEIDSEYALAHDNLGIVLRELGDSGEAIVHHERAAAIDPGFEDPHYQLGTIRMTQRDFPAAQAEFEEALRISPDDSRAKDGLTRARAALEGSTSPITRDGPRGTLAR